MKFFNWTWIGIVGADNDFRLYDSHKLTELIEGEGICVAFFEKISLQQSQDQILRIINNMKKSSAKIVFIYVSATEAIRFLQAASSVDISGKVWIAGAEWVTTPVFTIKEYWKILNGTLGMALAMTPFPGFQNFLNSIYPSIYQDDIFIKSFWEEAVGCWWPTGDMPTEEEMAVHGMTPPCTSKEMAEARYKGQSFKYVTLVHNTVYAFAYGLHDLLFCKSHHFSAAGCPSISHFRSWQVSRQNIKYI
ncbi:hypothetical protein NDU88_009331 [Pleurodeles waltl]|uniref:Receptor ligand binding region domain-containing protein n=1 Tax=Pleurodeles waltl TaxID=8319 RepID=A0AAV7PRX1_PLEWA|nr:hypothetical protein NDU88_009331 [Pleurodeles waltl]